MALNFDQIKGFIAELKSKGTEYAGAAVDKTKDAARLARLTVDLGGEKEALKKTFTELGKAYYEENRGTADGLFAQLCGEIDAVNARIEALQAEIDALKGGFRPGDGTADFEEVVAAAEEADIQVEIVEDPEE